VNFAVATINSEFNTPGLHGRRNVSLWDG